MRGAVRFVALLALLALLALPGVALAAPGHEKHGRPFTVPNARGFYDAKPLPTQVAGVTLSPAEGVASFTRSLTVTLADAAAGPLDVMLPAQFGARSANGRDYVPGRPSGAQRLTAADPSVTFDVRGLPGGTYELPITRGGKRIGVARFRLYTPRREAVDAGENGSAGGIFGRIQRVPIDSSQDSTDENESFVVLDPADPKRVVAYGNDLGYPQTSGDGGVSVSNDGGATWAHPQFPEVFDTPSGVDNEYPSGDPILAADTLGNVWAGGLSTCTSAAAQSRIFVNRIAPGSTVFQPRNAGLPYLHTGTACNSDYTDVIQDKPQMTIDNSPASPTYGRLYVAWDDPDTSPKSTGGDNVVVSFCDTRPGGVPNAAHCDTGANWSTPATVTDSTGSYVSSAVAVGPDGKVYVVWWDFSNANKISADMCDPALGACSNAAGWGTDGTVASLSARGAKIVPFECDTLAQPGGRSGPTPSIAVDHSGGPDDGRIYVAWSDLDKSGTTRCPDPGPPLITDDTFDAYVASATNFAALTSGSNVTSATRGTSVFSADGNHWFPWLAVDQSTGKAYVALYSTKDDATRTTTQFYESPITPSSGTQVTFDAITRVSTDSSTYADQPWGTFGNDYGDYTGIDAAQGVAAATWTHRHSIADDGDVVVDLPAPATPPAPPPPATTTATTPAPPPATTPPAPPLDRTPPKLRIAYATRVDRKGRYTLRIRATGEAAKGAVVLRIGTGKRRVLVARQIATNGARAFKVVLRLRSRDFRLLKRTHRLRVRLTVSLADGAGNAARGSKTFTLRPRRR